ncbi:GGDEF domain-containing protein [Acidithiobacillus montserratensis]|uniref:GGDEF domain-containing protein n=1 Tax=Acidithiobacillus montserratensis TaxID=2729135 RepID=A0ACD5HJR0_9PROT|nr:GGDEF domain-containing protein [Acidithiobacillus montserratensis]MBN2679199.1 GGDEF domain-containing protein [Acidithiobacillaceae bacterium]MBU2747760.1 GGDEF domain-containing protein [Acidithiobacillus montserratensis]
MTAHSEMYTSQHVDQIPDNGTYLEDLVNFYEAWKSYWQLWLREYLQGRSLPRQAEQSVLQALHDPESRIPEIYRIFWRDLQENYHRIMHQLQEIRAKPDCKSVLLTVMPAAEALERQCFDEIVAFSKNMGEVDPLTSLLNRRRMEQDLAREQSLVDRGASAYIAMLDVDHFKKLNDQFGHISGDRVLKELADRLRAQLRPYDGLYRYGGEEFFALFPRMQKNCALLTAQRLCQKIASEPFQLDQGRTIQVTISIGITTLLAQVPARERVIIADAALYQAKHEGRNQARLLP